MEFKVNNFRLELWEIFAIVIHKIFMKLKRNPIQGTHLFVSLLMTKLIFSYK